MFERLVWVVPAVVAATGLWRPRAALVSLAALLPLFGTSRGGPYMAALDVATVVAIAISLREPRAARTGLDLAVLGYLAVALASFFPLAYHPPSWQPSILLGLIGALANAQSWSGVFTWRALLDLALGCGLYVATRRAFAGRSPRPLALGVAGGLAVLVVLGLLEHAGWLDLGGYRAPAAAGRFHSLFFNSGWLAEYLVVATPFAIGGLQAGGGVARIASFGLLPLSLVALLLAQQRGAWLTALGQCALLALVLKPSTRRDPWVRRSVVGILAATALVAALFVLARPNFFSEVRNRLTRSDLFLRAPLWEAAGRLFLARPLLGWGIGTFHPGLNRLDRDSPLVDEARGEAHSTYLHVAAERGLLGLASLAFLMVAAGVSLRRDLGRNDADGPLAIGRAVALAGAALYGFVQYMWYAPPVGALIWVLLGCGSGPPLPSPGPLARRAARAGLAAACLLFAWRLLSVEAVSLAGNYSYGFHMPEVGAGATFEWTEGHAARRLTCAGDVLALELANGHPRGAARPVRVAIRTDGRTAGELEVRGGWERVRLPIGKACSDGAMILELLVHPTFRPFVDFRGDRALDPSRDERELGIAVRAFRFETGLSTSTGSRGHGSLFMRFPHTAATAPWASRPNAPPA
jgi:putative inorganic carbon (HCO3(-)) transporter